MRGEGDALEHKLLAELRRLEPPSVEDVKRKQIRSVVDTMTKAERRLLADVLIRFRSIGVDL